MSNENAQPHFVGLHGAKYYFDGMNVRIEKKDGKQFWIPVVDFFNFATLHQLTTQLQQTEETANALRQRIAELKTNAGN
jgi:hypothetical protein